MQHSIARVRRLFTVTIVGLCVASMASLLLVLYVASGISFSDTTSPQELTSLTKDYPAVAEYLRDQKKSEAHFITLANLIKDDQQQLLGKTALLATIPVLLASAVLGYFLARYLLGPVAEAYASQERFLQDAAHELRNPLATMSAAIQQARQPGADVSKQLAVLERQTNHLVHINEDLLFLERNQQREATPIDITELLRDVAETMQPLANKRNSKVLVKGKTALLAMHPDDFVSLARNLLENAVKYSKETTHGRVVASVVQTVRTTSLTVTDSGIGIPPTEIPHIGKRFYRATNVARREGNGLGFAIISKVAADYKADVKIDSVLGKGTTVTVTFKN